MTQSLALLTPDMTAAERKLIVAAVRGEIADLDGEAVRGDVLAELLVSARPGWIVHPGGLRLQRARISGGLDLDGITFDKPLFLSRVVIESDGKRGALLADDAHLKRLSLHDTRLDGALIADRAIFDGGLYLSGCDIGGPVQLRGARIAGPFSVEGSQVGDGLVSIDAAHLNVSGAVVLRRAALRGEARMARVRLGAGLQAEAASLAGQDNEDRAAAQGSAAGGAGSSPARSPMPSGLALDLSAATIEGDVLLADVEARGALQLARVAVSGGVLAQRLVVGGGGLSLAGADVAHALTLDEARLAGALDVGQARVRGALLARGLEVHGGRTAIAAERVAIAGDLDLERAKVVGALDCRRGDVAGSVRLSSARIFGAAHAVLADGLAVRGSVLLDKAVIVGCVQMTAAQVEQSLSLKGASVKVDRGAAVIAPGLAVGRDVLFGSGLRMIGAAVLEGARIGGTLDFADSQMTSVTLAGDAPGRAAGRSPAAKAEQGAAMGHDDHVIVLADAGMGRLVMARTSEDRPRGIVDLARARATAFEDYADAWPAPVELRQAAGDGRDVDHIVLAGFQYEYLVNPAGDEDVAPRGKALAAGRRAGERRIAWLEAQPVADVAYRFAPSAWRYLAERLAAQGFAADARRVHVARRRWQARSLDAGRSDRWRARASDLLTLHGYSPWRTLGWLAATIVVFAAIYGWAARQCLPGACAHGSAFVMVNVAAEPGASAQRGPHAVEMLVYSLDVALPFVDLSADRRWRIDRNWRPLAGELVAGSTPDAGSAARGVAPHATRSEANAATSVTLGQLLEGARVLEALIGLVLSLLAIAGFAGVLRDDR